MQPAERVLTEVAPGVWTATAEIWTSLTTIIVADDGGCLVVDPGITVTEVAGLVRAIEANGWTVVGGFSTHPHWDHVLWSRALGAVPRWATPRAAAQALVLMAHNVAECDGAAPGHDHTLTGRLTALPDALPGALHDALPGALPGALSGTAGGDLPWAGPRAVVVPHEGHCPGHAGLVLPAAGVLLAGDMLSELEIPLLDVKAADPLADYRAGLDALEAAAARHRIRVLVPGHGHAGDAAELARRLAADRRYLEDLEAGRPSDDERLRTPWLAQEHAAHVRRLHGNPRDAG